MSRLTRRRFVQLAAAGLGATAASGIHADFVIAGTKSSRRVLGANSTVRVAVAGIHGRGGDHIGEYANMKGVEIAYLVDPDSTLFVRTVAGFRRGSSLGFLRKRGKTQPATGFPGAPRPCMPRTPSLLRKHPVEPGAVSNFPRLVHSGLAGTLSVPKDGKPAHFVRFELPG